MKIHAKKIPVTQFVTLTVFLAFFIYSYLKSGFWIMILPIAFCAFCLLIFLGINFFRPVMLEISENYIITKQNFFFKTKKINRAIISDIFTIKQNQFIANLMSSKEENIIIETKYGRKITLMPASFDVGTAEILKELKK